MVDCLVKLKQFLIQDNLQEFVVPDRKPDFDFVQIMGRDKRMEFAETFFTCYNFRLMYTKGTLYPIVGALRCVYLSFQKLFTELLHFYLPGFVFLLNTSSKCTRTNLYRVWLTGCHIQDHMKSIRGLIYLVETRFTLSLHRLTTNQVGTKSATHTTAE